MYQGILSDDLVLPIVSIVLKVKLGFFAFAGKNPLFFFLAKRGWHLMMFLGGGKWRLKTSLITFMPCQREMARRGRRARKVLSDLRAVKFALPSMAKLKMETY